MSTNSKNGTTIQNTSNSNVQELRNRVEVLKENTFSGSVTGQEREHAFNEVLQEIDDVEIQETDPGIVEQYQTLQRDLFLKWDQLEQKKLRLRKRINKVENDDYLGEMRLVKTVIVEKYEEIIQSVESYQEELETTMHVLEFEEKQHAIGNR